jgi:hypothetical protein
MKSPSPDNRMAYEEPILRQTDFRTSPFLAGQRLHRYPGSKSCWSESSQNGGTRKRGLGIAVPPVINERPRAIGGPLEYSLRSGDDEFRRMGSTTVVVSIRRWIGNGFSVHH